MRNYIYLLEIIEFEMILIRGFEYIYMLCNFRRGRYSSTGLAPSEIKLQNSLASAAIMFVGNVLAVCSRCRTAVSTIPCVL